ncbi:MAG: tRNA pseudouridine(54/55) synthase Pus10 [Thermoplasmata archaeon M9B1D]|nr:MAG: tRNA pseudouridine(54/55) synthase Pus10 [Thermoplasmata archaeon M9B1D]PNX47436.1 MAG: tRNA pseudouridine(54/55) synthase Pus10 [Thermoplasmata archaeon M8B2D]
MRTKLANKKVLKNAQNILTNYKLCDSCLGRIFAKIETNMTNKKRGEILRFGLGNFEKIKVKDCWLCQGLIGEIKHFANLIKENLKGYEFETFLIGSKVDEDILEKENQIYAFAGSEYSESIKTELNREIGKLLEKKLTQEVNFEKPTIMAVIDTAFDVVTLQIASLYVYGRYKKYSREIPQTKWYCKICYGKGCKKCNYTGKIYDSSIQERISKTFLFYAQGEDDSFHGCGREDVDVRMLGNGRPFVLEIKNPKVRSLDLNKIATEINKINKSFVEVDSLRFSNHLEIERLKSAEFKKTYRATVKFDKIINNEKLKKATECLHDSKIGQLTPSRVAHRRADMVREKHIYYCKVESVDGSKAVFTLEAESGTYIKELVSGDNGRTKPSISEIMKIPCKVEKLDVIEIKGE